MISEENADQKKLQNSKEIASRIVKYPIPEQDNPKSGPSVYSTRIGYTLDWTLNTYNGASEKGFQTTEETHALKIQENTKLFEEWARGNNR